MAIDDPINLLNVNLFYNSFTIPKSNLEKAFHHQNQLCIDKIFRDQTEAESGGFKVASEVSRNFLAPPLSPCKGV